MSPVTAACFVVLIPALVAAATLLLARGIARRCGREGSHSALALALAAGSIAAQFGVARPAFPPADVADRIPFLVALATLLGLLEANRPTPAWARWENRLLLVGIILTTLLGPILGDTLATRAGVGWLAALVLAWLASWANLEALAARLPAARLLPTLVLAAAGAGMTLLLSGSMVLGFLGVGAAATAASCWCGSLRSHSPALARGAVPILMTSIGGLLVTGYVYAALPARLALLVLAAPLGAWAGAAGPLSARGGWKAQLGAGLATLAPLAVAVGFAVAWAEPEGY